MPMVRVGMDEGASLRKLQHDVSVPVDVHKACRIDVASLPATFLGHALVAAEKNRMPVSFADLLLSFEFVSSGQAYEHEAFLCRQSGKIYWHSEFGDNFEELPEDIEDDEKYIRMPHKNELGLGRPLVFAFVEERLPDDYDAVRRFFSKRGAYARFKDLLERKGALQEWYDFENKTQKKAIRDWCEKNSIEVSDEPES
jgi:hypothetical protein